MLIPQGWNKRFLILLKVVLSSSIVQLKSSW